MTDLLEEEQIEQEQEIEAPVELAAGKSSRQTDGLDAYIRKINKYPMLSVEDEYECVLNWQKTRDSRALDKLVNSHLRLAARIASGYMGYGLPYADLLSEGSVGILKAVDRFDVEKGFRFSTYASWWIQSAIKEYILRMWSMVRLGTTANQKKLFYQLRRLKRDMRAVEDNEIPDDYIDQISLELNIDRKEVVDMNLRMGGPDFSLNAPLVNEEGSEWQDALEDERENQEDAYMDRDQKSKRSELLVYALGALTEREYRIFTSRHLSEDPQTLGVIADELGLSRERIRQIEAAAMRKVTRAVKSKAVENRISAF
jgi:RNA polymerase sigma-32 factor